MTIAPRSGAVWGKGYQSDKLQKLQNRAFRIITRENYDIRSENILNRVGFSNLQTRREHQLAILMYRIKHKVLPNYLKENGNKIFYRLI